MIGGSSGTDSTLVQRRVARFCLFFGAANLAAGSIRSIILATGAVRFMVAHQSSLIAQLSAGALLLAGGAFLMTRKGCSRTTVRAVESGCLIVTGLAYETTALMLTQDVVGLDLWAHTTDIPSRRLAVWFSCSVPLLGTSFILTYAMILRATFVPTRPRYTALLTLVVGAGLPVVAFTAGRGAAQLGAIRIAPPLVALGFCVLWGVTVIVCATISRVIYGLRVEAREARRLGQYTLEELIGEGGMGRVYRASHLMLRRPTAIKLLPPERAGEEALKRFELEVQRTAQLTHPNTVTVYDYGRTADGVFYYAMELLEGATLEEIVEVDGPQPPERTVDILIQVAGALEEAHGIHLIHRDIKPSNIVLCRQGGAVDVAKVLDFGLVKELDEKQDKKLSLDGSLVGTPLYMAPEILRSSERTSPQSDLYALGGVGYYLLTGRHVFDGDSVFEVLGHQLHSEPTPPSQLVDDPIAPQLEALILACLAKTPEARPAGMRALREDLEALGLPSWSQRRAELWWEALQPAIEAQRRCSASHSGVGTTLAVDLGERKSCVD